MAGGDVGITSASAASPPTIGWCPTAEAAQILAHYEYRNRHVRAVTNRMLGYLVGWRYDASMEAPRRFVEQLPMSLFPAISR